MLTPAHFPLKPLALAIILLPAAGRAAQDTTLPEVRVTATAEQALKQAPGVSLISAEDIEKRPPANDLSEVIRRMPGVNLTGNAATGQRGNNRQIDLRGMGPENTLILIDGKPVNSRTSVRYGKSGERDTRGDSNWVPAEMVESVEVIRGPAAARYGSGSAGGVVNIITRGVSQETHGSVTLYTSRPQHSEEGDTGRVNFNLSGPLSETLGYRVYGNLNRTGADSPDINREHTAAGASAAAGREGVKNKDFSALLNWRPTAGQSLDLSMDYSRQGNIYAGDTQTGDSATSGTAATGANAASFLGQETNTMIRQAYALTHKGNWSGGKSTSYLQFEHTDNRRLDEGLVGGTEGNINSATKHTATLDGFTLHSHFDRPLEFGAPQVLTTGIEWNYQKLDDPATVGNATVIAGFPGMADSATDRKTWNEARMISAFVEDNIDLTDRFVLTPGLRLDQHSQFGSNWSPSLNSSYQLTSALTLKGGIARAFKAPNLYQTHASYLHYSSGNGCNKFVANTVRCYLLGNADLKPEISINKELGINWSRDGWNSGLTWFRNDYSSKIVAGSTQVGTVTVAGAERYVYRWENATDAIVEGLEGNLLVPLSRSLNWTSNITWMLRNDDQNGEPLSVIPQFTLNSALDWNASERLSLQLSSTFYGRQKSRTTNINTGVDLTGSSTTTLSPYNVWGLSAGYTFNKHWKGRAGVANLFDKRLFREGNSYSGGAASYNEPGRAFFLSLTASL